MFVPCEFQLLCVPFLSHSFAPVHASCPAACAALCHTACSFCSGLWCSLCFVTHLSHILKIATSLRVFSFLAVSTCTIGSSAWTGEEKCARGVGMVGLGAVHCCDGHELPACHESFHSYSVARANHDDGPVSLEKLQSCPSSHQEWGNPRAWCRHRGCSQESA